MLFLLGWLQRRTSCYRHTGGKESSISMPLHLHMQRKGSDGLDPIENFVDCSDDEVSLKLLMMTANPRSFYLTTSHYSAWILFSTDQTKRMLQQVETYRPSLVGSTGSITSASCTPAGESCTSNADCCSSWCQNHGHWSSKISKSSAWKATFKVTEINPIKCWCLLFVNSLLWVKRQDELIVHLTALTSIGEHDTNIQF